MIVWKSHRRYLVISVSRMLGTCHPRARWVVAAMATIPQSTPLLCCGKSASRCHLQAPFAISLFACTLMPIRRRFSCSSSVIGECQSLCPGRFRRSSRNSPSTWSSLSASTGSCCHRFLSALADASRMAQRSTVASLCTGLV